jgi:DNA primase (bacterial type)
MITNKRKAEIIRESVTMPEVLQAYGIREGKRGRIPCPIHGGHNESSFSYNQHQFQCFNCGAKGGVIQFVQEYLECSFEKALDEFNRLFHLWDAGDECQRPSVAERLRRETIRRKREEKRRKEAVEIMKKETAILRMHQLIGNKIRFAPESEADEWDQLYIDSLKNLEVAQYRVDCL